MPCVGNREDAPAIEFFVDRSRCTQRWTFAGRRSALAGHFSATLTTAEGQRQLPSWRSLTLAPGERLHCDPLSAGRLGYVALAGCSVPWELGSASTDARAGIGGLDGRLLSAGAQLPARVASGGDKTLRTPPRLDSAAIRVVLGPQADYFDEPSLARFLCGTYQVTPAADRMGMRLAGPRLGHRPEKGAEIVSDATVPGSIQVPGDGQPIVLLADGQTVGGYPKIATVISADLPRLAVRVPGQSVHFAAVSVTVAEQAARRRQAVRRALIGDIVPLTESGGVDLQAIYAVNLVSGVVDAREADDRDWRATHQEGTK
jgi:biotin-dependent carboxylase-like uncharacterized protein